MLSIDLMDWAFWLDSIAQDPHQRNYLTKVDGEIQYLNHREIGQMQKNGHFVQRLSLDQIIKITQNIWKDSEADLLQKRQMLAGVHFIHHRRQEKYDHLFWLVRIFAKLKGQEGKLRTEAQKIQLLEEEWQISLNEGDKKISPAKSSKLSLSLIRAIEKIWREVKQSDQEAKTRILEGRRVIFIPKSEEIYLKEGMIAKGTSKATFLATPFHSLKKPEDRGSLVILQPIHAVLNEIEEEKSPKGQAHPATFNFIGSIDQDQYQKEARNCEVYGQLPGIWATEKIRIIDGEIAIFQPAAGYDLTTRSHQRMTAISLEDMITLFDKGELLQKEQLVLLKMVRGFLTGVESLHKLDVLHRDLKPENILCTKEGTAAISDLATLCENKINIHPFDTEKVHNPEKKYLVGTPYYLAPEIACYYSNPIHWMKIDLAVDIWATGLILWQAFSGKPLLKHPAYQITREGAHHSQLLIIQALSEILSHKTFIYHLFYGEPKAQTSLAHLVWRCTREDSVQRPLIQEVIKQYDAWESYARAKIVAGEIQSIEECFEDDIV